MDMIKQCLQKCFRKGKAKTEEEHNLNSTTSSNDNVDEEDWGSWEDDIENQTSSPNSGNSSTPFSSSRQRSGSGNNNSSKLSNIVNNGNSNDNNLYANSVNPAVRKSRPRNTSWMKNKNKHKKRISGSSSSSTIFATKKAEDIFADMGIERRSISKQNKMRVKKRIELKGNVSSRFADDTDTNEIGDAWDA